MASAIPRRTIKQLFLQACTEIPEVIGGTAIALVGVSLALIGHHNYYKNDGDNRKYKNTYTIMRSDDPRAKLVHKD